MPSTFVRARNRNLRLLHTARSTGSETTPPSLVVVGVGTAGVRRALLFTERMSELSASNRIQSVVYYDCNDVSISNVQKALRLSHGSARNGNGLQVIYPNYIPLPNGFMRDPTRHLDYRGPLERDLDNIVNQVVNHSERCAREPETIVEFMGFSGHAVLGGRLHRKLQEVFPNTVILPVMMLPGDHVSEEWTRRYIWEQYEDLLAGTNCLVTSQSDINTREDDMRLATGLAGFEVAEFADETDASISQLGVTYRRLVPASGGWLAMASVKRKMQTIRKFEWMNVPPWWREYAAVGTQEEFSSMLGSAIWATLESTAQLAEGVGAMMTSPQEIVVSLPLHGDELEPVAVQAAEALERSTIFDRFTNLDIAFNTARFTEGTEAEPYMHITRIYPVQGELQAVRAILGVSAAAGDAETEGRVDTGFGSYFHLGTPLLPSALSSTEEVETEDWDPNVRYI